MGEPRNTRNTRKGDLDGRNKAQRAQKGMGKCELRRGGVDVAQGKLVGFGE